MNVENQREKYKEQEYLDGAEEAVKSPEKQNWTSNGTRKGKLIKGSNKRSYWLKEKALLLKKAAFVCLFCGGPPITGLTTRWPIYFLAKNFGDSGLRSSQNPKPKTHVHIL